MFYFPKSGDNTIFESIDFRLKLHHASDQLYSHQPYRKLQSLDWPPSYSTPIRHDFCRWLLFHSCLIIASKGISLFTRIWPPSANLQLLWSLPSTVFLRISNQALQVNLLKHSITTSQYRSQNQLISTSGLVQMMTFKCIWPLIQSQPPGLHIHGLNENINLKQSLLSSGIPASEVQIIANLTMCLCLPRLS
jgi:hypothetical protein